MYIKVHEQFGLQDRVCLQDIVSLQEHNSLCTRDGGKISDLGSAEIILNLTSETGIQKFFGLNKISFDHEWPNC